MSLNVTVLKEVSHVALIERHADFGFLSEKSFNIDDKFKWNRDDKITHDLHIIFIGKTGYGKSTTINKIIGENIFETSDIAACTSDLYTIDYYLNQQKEKYICFADLPGVGENLKKDKQYKKWYKSFIKKSIIVVYLLRADQRDYSIDLDIYNELLRNSDVRIIIGLNYCDKIEPLNRNNPFEPSSQQYENIKTKIDSIANIFDVCRNEIVPYSADCEWNVHLLVKTLAGVVKEHMY